MVEVDAGGDARQARQRRYVSVLQPGSSGAAVQFDEPERDAVLEFPQEPVSHHEGLMVAAQSAPVAQPQLSLLRSFSQVLAAAEPGVWRALLG